MWFLSNLGVNMARHKTKRRQRRKPVNLETDIRFYTTLKKDATNTINGLYAVLYLTSQEINHYEREKLVDETTIDRVKQLWVEAHRELDDINGVLDETMKSYDSVFHADGDESEAFVNRLSVVSKFDEIKNKIFVTFYDTMNSLIHLLGNPSKIKSRLDELENNNDESK